MMALGPALITHLSPNWYTVQLPLIRRMRAECARVPIAGDFGNPPGVGQDLVNAGVTTIILNTSNPKRGQVLREVVDDQFVGHGWLDLVRRTPQVQWILELGNEPDTEQDGSPAVALTQHRAGLLDVLRNVRPQMLRTVGNLSFAVSAPIGVEYARKLFTPDLLAVTDAICPHVYGGLELADEASREHRETYEWLLANTDRPLWLTEIGIDGPRSTAEKGIRMARWLSGQPEKVRGACVFTISDNTRWRSYWIDTAMADAFAARASAPAPVPPATPASDPAPPRPKPPAGALFFEDGLWLAGRFRRAWERHGGLRVFGAPITPEFEEDGRTVQYTERGRFEHHPGEWPDEEDVMFGLLGREAYQARYGRQP